MADHAAAIEKLPEGETPPDPPQPPDIQPWPGEPVWCGHCQALLRRELAEIDVLASIAGSDDPRTSSNETMGRITTSPSSPSPSARMDGLEELAEWLRSWESIGRGEDSTPPRRGYLAKEITETTAWLVFHFDQLITHPAIAADFGAETRRWHRELSAMANAGQANKHMKKRCPRCRLYTLWWTIGADYIRCINEDCGRMLKREEYDILEDAA